jgi:hypothetical protein
MARFEIYQDAKHEFRWRFHANNGKILAESREGYLNRDNCRHAIILIKQETGNATISDEALADSAAPARRSGLA